MSNVRSVFRLAVVFFVVACSVGTPPSEPVRSSSQADTFESRASFLGRVVDVSGNPITNATFSVVDLPCTPTGTPPQCQPRTDVTPTTDSDGSFRLQLTSFSNEMTPYQAAFHEIVYVNVPGAIPMSRTGYVRSGDAVDFGDIVITQRDSNVTNIGPAGGTASDSGGLVTVTIPPGALSTTIPVQITPFATRDQLPAKLPSGTLTTYAFELEPEGTTFSSPVTVTVTNTQNLPSTLSLPVGVYDPTIGEWSYEAQATLGSGGWSYTVSHFSLHDVNAPQLGDLILRILLGYNPQNGQKGCLGSAVGFANGSLQQAFSLPTYNVRNQPFGVTLHYDSGLAGSRHFNDGSGSSVITSGVVSPSGYDAPVQSTSITAQCVPRSSAGAAGKAKDSCNAGTCSLSSTATNIQATEKALGTKLKLNKSLLAGLTTVDSGGFINVPLDQNGNPIDSSFVQQSMDLNVQVSTTCSGSGTVVFGNNSPDNIPQTANLTPSPISYDQKVFVHHRFTSPYGAGWSIPDVDRIYME